MSVPRHALVVPAATETCLPDVEALMRKYHDRPMDVADATLVGRSSFPFDALRVEFTLRAA